MEVLRRYAENRNYLNIFEVTSQAHHIDGNRNGVSPVVHTVNLNFMTNQTVDKVSFGG